MSANDPPALDWTAIRLQRLDARRPLRRLPHLVGEAARLLWRTSPSRFTTTAVIQVLLAVGMGTQVVAGRDALAVVLDGSARGVAPIVSRPLVVLGLVTVAIHLLRAVEHVSQDELRQRVAHAALAEVLDVAAAVDLEAFESPTFFDRLQRATVAARDRPWATVHALILLAASAFGLVALGSVVAALEPVLLPFVVAATIPGVVVTTRMTKARFRLHLLLQQDARRQQHLVQMLTGRDEAKEVRSFDLAPTLRAMHDELADKQIDAQVALARKSARERLVATGLGSATTGVGVLLLLWLVARGRLGVPDAAAAGYAMQRIQRWLASAARGVTSIYDGALFLDDYAAFVDLGREAEARRPAAEIGDPFHELRLEGVSFTYPGAARAAVRDIDVTLRAGEVVALVGENGSGKTTLAKLLCGLFTPTAGTVRWDGADLRTVDPRSVRRHVAVIFQDFARYRLSAAHNIGLGRAERAADRAAVARAAVEAGADTFLEKLPDGYDTVLTKDLPGGRDLSIGQWQRVALARAFFRDAPMLVLDEPTSALDPRAEHALFEHIRRLAAGRTVVLISHRLSSVRGADRILVLDAGQIVEQGNHASLVAAGGQYAELFALQARAYREQERDRATL